MSTETFRGSGPADALGAVLRRLGGSADAAILAARFELHDNPTSLAALVHVARECGLTARGFQGGLDDLRKVEFPAVVHLKSGLEEDGSFGVLVAADAGSFTLEGPSGSGASTLPAEAFAAIWSGIVVTFSRPEAPLAAPREPGALATWAALLRTDRQAAVMIAARVLAAAGTIALALYAARSWPGRAMVVLDALAAATSIVLFHASRRTRVASATPRLAQKICGHGAIGDCEGVLGTKWARIGGFDLPVVGLAFAASNLVLAAFAAFAPEPTAAAIFAWILAAHVVAVPSSLFFIGLQVWPLRRFCPLCMTVHACVLAAAALTPWLWAPAAITPLIAAVHAAAFFAIAGLVVPFLELALESRANRARLGWIAATPWGALAEAAGRAPAFSTPPESAFSIGAPGAPLRIDALVHPFCTGCGPVVEGLVELVGRREGELQVVFHLAPRDAKDPGDLALCAAISTIALLAGGDQAVHVFRAVKADPRKYLILAQDGEAPVVAAFLAGGEAIERAIPAAREAVERDRALADRLKTGTPTLLVNGRVWESTLDDLDRLLARHPELAATVLGAKAAR